MAPDAVTPALNLLAQALRAQGQCGPWRDEQLAVCNAHGERLGTIERGAVRVLGIATRAVHLVGRAPDGRIWVQQRSKTKPNNPGMWDTLMGGMVSAADTLQQALERETWEEAGLRLPELLGSEHGGQVDFSRPSREGGGVGYMVERIDWFRCTVPEGLEPRNQDGEVERFELWSPPRCASALPRAGSRWRPRWCWAPAAGFDSLHEAGRCLCDHSVSKSFVSRREAAGSAVARQGEATTTRVI